MHTLSIHMHTTFANSKHSQKIVNIKIGSVTAQIEVILTRRVKRIVETLRGVSHIYSDNNIMCAKCGSVKLTALLSVAANFVLVACEDQSSSKPTVAMSVIYLAIPVMIGVTAMALLTRKLYIACAKKFQPEEDVAIREFAEEFSTSLDTTDSFDQVKLKNNEEEHITVPWNPFHKRYVNVETKNDLDPLEEMEARFVERKMIKVNHLSVRLTLMLQKCNTAISPFSFIATLSDHSYHHSAHDAFHAFVGAAVVTEASARLLSTAPGHVCQEPTADQHQPGREHSSVRSISSSIMLS